MDIASTLVGKSDQLDNVDLLHGPRDFTITGVTGGTDEQPLNIALAEYDRPWRPGLTMRRLLAAVWETTDASKYVGRRVRLYRDPEVLFGKDKTGGTRVSHMSHIDKPVTVSLPKSRGKFAAHTVQPLTDAPPTPNDGPSAEDIAACENKATLTEWWHGANPTKRKLIEARAAELDGGGK